MAFMRFQAPRGTRDVLPQEAHRWVHLEKTFRDICHLYGYSEIRTPTFEDTELFVRGVGEGTDIVSKEMYTFKDRAGRSLTLKPEGTAPVIRAYLEHSLGTPNQITRLFYITPIFRYERPQKGRLRESHQTGVELIGSGTPDADAEVIELTVRFYQTLGIRNISIKLNSLGEEECRKSYREALLEYARPHLRDFPEEFRARCEKNPLRLLDSKDPEVQKIVADAPPITRYYEKETIEHFESLQKLLNSLGITYEIDPKLVRGLDYYTKTVFEVQSEFLGAQNALCGGGRYDNLIEEYGGQPTPAVGVAMGIERALMVMETLEIEKKVERLLDVFAVCLTENRIEFAKFVKFLRDSGISVVTDLEFRSAKSQFRQADKSGANYAVILGDEELEKGVVKVKDMRSGEEVTLPSGEVLRVLRHHPA